MPKIPSIRAREVVRVAESIGFVLDRQRGSHAVYYRASDKRRIVIPMHFFGPATLGRFIASASSMFDIETKSSPVIVLAAATLPVKPKLLVLPGY